MHPPKTQTEMAKESARDAFLRALVLARGSHFDGLAIDAMHMMAFVDTDPDDHLRWNRMALTCIEASDQRDARKWEGSIRHNLGYALFGQQRYDDARAQFERSLAARQREGDVRGARIARWMIASTCRAMGRLTEALEIQRDLEQEWAAAGEVDPYVFEELEALYQALGDEEQAQVYADRLARSRAA